MVELLAKFCQVSQDRESGLLSVDEEPWMILDAILRHAASSLKCPAASQGTFCLELPLAWFGTSFRSTSENIIQIKSVNKIMDLEFFKFSVIKSTVNFKN